MTRLLPLASRKQDSSSVRQIFLKQQKGVSFVLDRNRGRKKIKNLEILVTSPLFLQGDFLPSRKHVVVVVPVQEAHSAAHPCPTQLHTPDGVCPWAEHGQEGPDLVLDSSPELCCWEKREAIWLG